MNEAQPMTEHASRITHPPIVCIFGSGYIGLPTACLFGTHGYNVVGIDSDKRVVQEINKGKVLFEEPRLQELLKSALAANSLVAKIEPEIADVFLIAVPTPLDKETRMADLRYVREAANAISRYIKRGNMVILESSVPPGACDKLLYLFGRHALYLRENLHQVRTDIGEGVDGNSRHRDESHDTNRHGREECQKLVPQSQTDKFLDHCVGSSRLV